MKRISTLILMASLCLPQAFAQEKKRDHFSVFAGYEHVQLTNFMAIGVNYTGWQIGYEFKSSANAKLTFSF